VTSPACFGSVMSNARNFSGSGRPESTAPQSKSQGRSNSTAARTAQIGQGDPDNSHHQARTGHGNDDHAKTPAIPQSRAALCDTLAGRLDRTAPRRPATYKKL